MQPRWFAGYDLQTERSVSFSTGMSDQLWPIHDTYVIDGNTIKPQGKHRFYYPMSRPRLPFELAKIPDSDSEAALFFVSNWGLLGRASLLEQQPQIGEDTLLFVWGHAYTIRNVLNLFDALQDGSRVVLERTVNSIVHEDAIYKGSNELKQCWLHMEGASPKVSAELRRLSPEDLALKIIAESISKNLEGMSPVVETLRLDNEPPSDSTLSRLQFTFRYQALVQCAYWHLAMMTSRNGGIAQCRECSGFFERTDKRQQFCPPSDEQVNEVRSGKRSRPQSRCALRNRARRWQTEHS